MSMSVTRAIEVIDKINACNERVKVKHCDICDTDNCQECELYEPYRNYDEAVKVLHKFAKNIKRRFTRK